MKTAEQALAFANVTKTWAVGMCDNFVANAFGYGNSGYATAAQHWQASTQKHPGDRAAPAGSLLFWGGGAGHVAISDGGGGIWSTDINGEGTVGHVPSTYIDTKWSKPYLGWAAPEFGGVIGSTGGVTGASPVSGVTPVSFAGIPNPADAGKAVEKAITQTFLGLISPVLKYLLWGGEFLIGLAMIIGGSVLITRGASGGSF
jgi:hypothetical protein